MTRHFSAARLYILLCLLCACALLQACGGGKQAGAELVPVAGPPAPAGQAANGRQASTSYSVAGKVRQSNYTGISGVTVTFSDGQGSTSSDATGNYIKFAVSAGTRTVTPSKSGWWFSPASKTVNVNQDLTGINFIGYNTWNISGNVHTLGGTGLYGVNLAFSNGTNATTNSAGNYLRGGFANGTYTVTPSKAGWVFDPAYKTVTITNNHATYINFYAELKDWQHSWGGSYNDSAARVALDSSGNCYVVGETDGMGAGGKDCVVLKFDRDGSLIWRRTWGGPGLDSATGAIVDGTDFLVVCGATQSYGEGGYDAFLLKYNSAGVLQWQRAWGGGGNEAAADVGVDGSGNFYCTGYTNSVNLSSDLILLKYNSSGTLQWQRLWGTTDDDEGRGLTVNSAGDAFIAGYTYGGGYGFMDAVVAKYNSSGTLQWRRVWGSTGNESCFDTALDASGNIYACGLTDSYGGGGQDMLLLKLSSAGAVTWRRTYGWAADDLGMGVVVDNQSYVYVLGEAADIGAGHEDFALWKYNSSGGLQAKKRWGGAASDEGLGIAIDSRRFVRLCGRAPRARSGGTPYGSWANFSDGMYTTSGGSSSAVIGTAQTPALTAASISGSVGTPGGVIDSGAGQEDMFVIKYSQ